MQLKIEKMKKESFQAKTGKQYNRVKIMSGGRVYSCLEGFWNKDWKIGDTIDVEFEAKTFKGQTEYQIQAPQRVGGNNSNPKIDEILDLCKKILEAVSNKGTEVTVDFEEQVPASEGNPIFDEEIPF